MANHNLKHALQQAGLTPEEFAEVVRVDPKTVQRWLAGTTTPYARHRATIARALDMTEHQLWPDETPQATSGSGPAVNDEAAGSEVAGTWAYDTEENAPDPIAFILQAQEAIDLLDNGRGIALTAALVSALAEQATAGRHVRLLTYLPKPRLEPLIGHQQIEIRVIDPAPEHSLLRIGEAMLLTFNLAAERDRSPPLLKLQRTVGGGLFDRLADNFDTLWADPEEILTDLQQLDAYLTNADEDDGFDDEDGTDLSEPNELAAAKPPRPAAQAGKPARTDTEQTERRWPRRPN
ncbi:MAG: helix-turn-helix transcriptional regulator [Solirubrobacteraceae bacterium]